MKFSVTVGVLLAMLSLMYHHLAFYHGEHGSPMYAWAPVGLIAGFLLERGRNRK